MCLAQHVPACSHLHSLAQCVVQAGHKAPQTPLSALDEAAWPTHDKETPRVSHQLLFHQPGACAGAQLKPPVQSCRAQSPAARQPWGAPASPLPTTPRAWATQNVMGPFLTYLHGELAPIEGVLRAIPSRAAPVEVQLERAVPAGEAPAADGDVLRGRLTRQVQHHCKGSRTG